MPDENKPPGEVVPPQGQTDTAAVLNALGSRTIAEAPKVETPEEQQVRIVNESLRASLDQYDNLPPAEKAKVDPTLVARLEAFRTNPNALNASAAAAPEPVATVAGIPDTNTTQLEGLGAKKPDQGGTRTIPGTPGFNAGLGGSSTGRLPITEITGRAAADAGINFGAKSAQIVSGASTTTPKI